MVIYDKDYATIVNEEVKECADENILFSDEDPTIIDKDKAEECVDENKKLFAYEDPTTIGKYKVEECVDEKILFSDEDPTTNNKEEAEVWNDVKHCQAAQSTQRFAGRRQTILMLRSNSKIETSFMSCVNTGADIVHWTRDAHKDHRASNTLRLLARSPYSRTAEIVRMCRLLYSRRKMGSRAMRRSMVMAGRNAHLRTGPVASQKSIHVPQVLAVPPLQDISKATVDRWSRVMAVPNGNGAAGGEGCGSNDQRSSTDASSSDACHQGDGDGGNVTGEGGAEREDAGDDQDDNDGTGATASSAAVRCSCVVCNLQLGAVGFVLIPRRGYAHRACTEEFFPDYMLPPRTRQQPTRLVPALGGTSHLQRDSEVTRPIVPLTHQHSLQMIPTNPRTMAVGGRRRGGVGQGRGPAEDSDQRTDAASRVSLAEMLGLWVALPGGRRCLVVATGIGFTTGQQALLVAPRDGGRRLAVPWQHGGSGAVIIQNEPRELAEGRLPALRADERP